MLDHSINLGTVASEILPHIRAAFSLSEPALKKLIERIYCFAFKVRLPRKDDRSCNKTPYFSRCDTSSASYLTQRSPLYATQAECEAVAAMLLAQLFEADGVNYDLSQVPNLPAILGRPPAPGRLHCLHQNQLIAVSDIQQALRYSTQRLGSYDLPVTYVTELSEGGIHRHQNVTWMKPLHINYKLRERLKGDLLRRGVSTRATKNALDKIQVKAYCTDKVTMPPFFSNRDVRWATWHKSNQYASHYECAMIELELMAQLYEFSHAPVFPNDLEHEITLVRGKSIQPHSMKCYITGRDLDFDAYVSAAIDPKGGRSPYHVGHLIPLTREGGKHTWLNVVWISDDGNRIQGNDTLNEIEQKLIQAVEYHLRRDLAHRTVNPEKVQQLWQVLNDIRDSLGLPKVAW